MQAPPELTPEKLNEVIMWLWVSAGLVVITWLPFLILWLHERKEKK